MSMYNQIFQCFQLTHYYRKKWPQIMLFIWFVLPLSDVCVHYVVTVTYCLSYNVIFPLQILSFVSEEVLLNQQTIGCKYHNWL